MRERQKTRSFNAEERRRSQDKKRKTSSDAGRRGAGRPSEGGRPTRFGRLREWASNDRSLPFVPPLFEREREWYEGYRIRYQFCWAGGNNSVDARYDGSSVARNSNEENEMERKVKLFLLAAIVVYFGYAQTGISPTSQVKPCPVAATPMFVLSVAGLAAAGQPSVICAGLDPRAFSIDLTTTPPEIHLITVPNFVYGETPGGAVDGKNRAFASQMFRARRLACTCGAMACCSAPAETTRSPPSPRTSLGPQIRNRATLFWRTMPINAIQNRRTRRTIRAGEAPHRASSH